MCFLSGGLRRLVIGSLAMYAGPKWVIIPRYEARGKSGCEFVPLRDESAIRCASRPAARMFAALQGNRVMLTPTRNDNACRVTRYRHCAQV
jgi:hypothetical protein